jgi:hypothetical protein
LLFQTSGWTIGIRIPQSAVLAMAAAFSAVLIGFALYLRGQASRQKITEDSPKAVSAGGTFSRGLRILYQELQNRFPRALLKESATCLVSCLQ